MPHKFIVKGVDKSSGMDTELVVYAESQENAQVKAELRDIIVTNCKLSKKIVMTEPTPHRETSSGDQPDTYRRSAATSSSVMMHPALPPTIVAIVAVAFLIVTLAGGNIVGWGSVLGSLVAVLILACVGGYVIQVASRVVMKVAAPYDMGLKVALVSMLLALTVGGANNVGYLEDIGPFGGILIFILAYFFIPSVLAAHWIKYPESGPIGIKKGMLISLVYGLMWMALLIIVVLLVYLIGRAIDL